MRSTPEEGRKRAAKYAGRTSPKGDASMEYNYDGEAELVGRCQCGDMLEQDRAYWNGWADHHGKLVSY